MCLNAEVVAAAGCYDTCDMCARTTYPPPTISLSSFADCNHNKTNCHSQIGREFYLMFLEDLPSSYNDYSNLELIITADAEGIVNIQCPAISVSITANLHKGSQSFTLDKAAKTRPLQNERKGVRVSATVDISVYAMNMRLYQSEGFTALPVDIIGKKYTVITFTPTRKSLIGITAIEDDTKVTIRLNCTNPITIEGVQRSVKTGPFQLILNRYHTFQLEHSEDLSGTRIESDKSVSVVTGNQCSFGADNRYNYQCTHLCEQVPPITSWGRNFIVPSIRNIGSSVIRIVAAYGYTNITVTGKTIKEFFELADPNYRKDVNIGKQTVSIEASGPIYVLLIPQFTSNDYNGFMVSVPAVEQYGHYYHIATPPAHFSTHYMVVLVSSKSDSLRFMRLNNNHIDENAGIENTMTVNGEDHTALTFPISPKDYTVTNILPSSNFGLLVYGFGTHEAYGYPGGMNLKTE